MTSEEQNTAAGEEAAPETPDETTDAPPAMNRAQRRAMAKGKKGASGGINPAAPQAGNTRGFNGRTGNKPGQSYLPRTGHK